MEKNDWKTHIKWYQKKREREWKTRNDGCNSDAYSVFYGVEKWNKPVL